MIDRLKGVLSKSLTLRPQEWILLSQISAMLPAILVVQRMVSLPKLMEMFDAKPAGKPRLSVEPDRLVYLVTGLVRNTLHDRYCMKRSILMFHFLRKWGYDAQIIFGVMKEADKTLKGHAWVELEGNPLAERGDPRSRYVVTYSYPTKEIR